MATPCTEPAPAGLDDAGKELWQLATASLVHPAVAGVALRIRAELTLQAKINRLQADSRSRLSAMVSVAVSRLGGVVEGWPTHWGNFLRRIDELREIERRWATAR